jgi:hypothetical protein
MPSFNQYDYERAPTRRELRRREREAAKRGSKAERAAALAVMRGRR